jgi:hypothetical protein
MTSVLFSVLLLLQTAAPGLGASARVTVSGRISVEGNGPGPFFLYPALNPRRVANDQAANRRHLSGTAASGRVPRGRAIASPCRIYAQIDRVWRS